MTRIIVIPPSIAVPSEESLESQPTWLAAELHYADGRIKRFGPDERDDADVPKDIQFDTQIPGGFGSGSLVLPRPPKLRADDAALFSHARIYGPMRTAYEGRVVGVPQVGPEEIRLELEGWSAHLDDDETFREVFIDRDLSRWGEPSTARQAVIVAANFSLSDVSTQQARDDGGLIGFLSTAGGPINKPRGEIIYDAGPGNAIARIRVSSLALINLSTGDGAVGVAAHSWTDDNSGGAIVSSEQRANSSIDFSPSTAQRYAVLGWQYNLTGGGSAGNDYGVRFSQPSLIGNHGLTLQGASPDDGFLASDILAYCLSKSAPLLSYTLGDSIEQSTFPIPHLVFLEPVVPRQVVEIATGLGGAPFPNDWGVYENREFFHKTPGSYGRTWRIRGDVSASPTSEGPQSKDRIGGIMVSYRDGAGRSHSVGPSGSGAEYETTDLLDTNPQNPANRLGRRWAHRQVGIINQQGALNIGRMLLAEANQVDWRGTTVVRGDVQDSAGNTHPVQAIRAGDRAIVEDEDGLSEHPIASTSYGHSDLACTVNIGAPPHSAEVMLAQLEAATDLVAA